MQGALPFLICWAQEGNLRPGAKRGRLTITALTTEWYSVRVCRDGSVPFATLMIPTASNNSQWGPP